MSVVQEKIDDLNAILKVKLTPADYKEQFNKKINEYRNQVNVPGFRKGKVPMGMIKKKYGPSILADEIQKIINEELYQFITENKIGVLGNPLPKDDASVVDSWTEDSDFEFAYEIGLSPEIDLKLSKRDKVTYHKIKVDKDLVEKQMEDFAKRYGKMESVEVSEETDMLLGDFAQLDEKGNVIEEGITNRSSISIQFTDDKKAKKQLIGLKVGDTITLDPKTVSKGDADMAAMLNIKKDQLPAIEGVKFNYTVVEVKRLHPAELNQELFDKIFGEGNVKGEKEFRERIETELGQMFSADSERLFHKELADKLVEKFNPELPNDFLKRWIKATNEKPITDEQLEKEYTQYANGLKWQLIENKIIESNEIKVEMDEAINYTKGLLLNQYNQYRMPHPSEEELTQLAQRALGNQEEGRRIFDTLYSQKVVEFLKDKIKVEEEEVSQDDFVKLFNN